MDAKNKGIYSLGLLGLMFGFSLDVLWRHQVAEVYPYTLLTLFALLFGLAYNHQQSLRLIFTSFLVAAFLTLPVLPLSPYADGLATEQVFSMLLLYPVFCYIGHSFHYAYHHGNSFKLNYSKLYAAVWNSIPLLMIASVFLCLSHLLVILTALIFKTANLNFLYDLYFHNVHFLIVFNGAMFFIGLGIGQQSLKMVYNLTHLLARMMYYLYPFLAFISILYVLLYWINTSTSGKQYIDPLFILPPLIILGIIFFNGYFQDGKHLAQYSKTLNRVLKVYRVVLFVLTSMLTYHIFKVMSLPLNGLLFLSVLVLYAVAYAVTACMSKDHENEMIRRLNIAIALFFLVAFFTFNNPAKPVNLVIGKDGFRIGSVTKPFLDFPKAKALTPGAEQMVQIQKDQQRLDHLLQKAGLFWQDKPSDETYTYESGSQVLSICRSLSKNGYQFGIYQNNQCQINVDGKLVLAKNVQLLASKKDVLTWTKSDSELKLAVELNPRYNRIDYDSSYRPSDIKALNACMVEIEGHLYIGKTVYKSCLIVLNGKEQTYQNPQYLNLKAHALVSYVLNVVDEQLKEQGYQWVKPSNNQAMIAGYFGNEPMHICRSLYDGSYQVGQYLNGQCMISHEGKAFNVDEHDLLTLTGEHQVHWTSGYDHMPVKPDYLATGFEFSKEGTVHYLYSCRTIYDNQIHIGKLLAGQCSIGFDGDEVAGQGMQILAKNDPSLTRQ